MPPSYLTPEDRARLDEAHMMAMKSFQAITDHERWCEEEGRHAREYRADMKKSIAEVVRDQKWQIRLMITVLVTVVLKFVSDLLPHSHGG